MATAIRNLHRERFGHYPAHVVQVPGQVSLLGEVGCNHEGLVLCGAVDRYLWVSISPRSDGRVRWDSPVPGEAEEFWLDEIERGTDSGGVRSPVRRLLGLLRRKRVHFSGFNAAMHCAFPDGWDLGQSAARRLGLVLALRRLFPFSLEELGAGLPPSRDRRGEVPPWSRAEKALFARWCRSGGLGEERATDVGMLACLLGKAWHLTAVDGRFWTVDRLPLVGEALVVTDPCAGGRWEWAQGAGLDEEAWGAARLLGAGSLRSVDLALLKSNRVRLEARHYGCAYHVVGELQRVVHAEQALREEDHAQFGHYLALSHESARECFRRVWAEAELVVALARQAKGCRGARQMGPEWGGLVLSVVSYHEVEPFMESLTRRFRELVGVIPRCEVLQLVDGVG